MEMAVFAFVMSRLEQVKRKLVSVNELERAGYVRDIQLGILNDSITDLQNEARNGMSEDGLTNKEEEELHRGGKVKDRIPLIKMVRERTGMGLLETKKFTEKLYVKYGYGYFSFDAFYWKEKE